jgi:L,D-peptidoglycan transpeptidase YkuD (ErfK/YbiS/YcfS/YnhG family)
MRSLRKSIAFVAGFAALLAAGVVLTQQADATTIPAYDPRQLTHVGDARQLIVVTGVSTTSTYATVRTYQRGAGLLWVQKFPPMAARVGYAGWAKASARVQGTGTTPWGTFGITDAFGLKANPGTKLPYRLAGADDYWVGDNKDAKTYNMVEPSAATTVTWRTSESEKLSGYPTQYEYAAVIDFNRPDPASITWNATLGEYVTSKPANVKIGSAIFLHINGAGDTAGCVSLARADLLSVLTWLDPALKPRIVMAPLSLMGQA